MRDYCPVATIVLPMSRDWRIEDMQTQIESLSVGAKIIDVLVISDGLKIFWPTYNYGPSVWGRKCTPRILYMDENMPGESNSFARRQRIADILNLARNNIAADSDYVFIVEDDTEIKPHFLTALSSYFPAIDVEKGLVRGAELAHHKYEPVGTISAAQAGRWAASMFGAWKTDNIANPTTYETLPLGNTIEAVDATGLYCTLIRADLFRDTPFRCTYQGPDVNFGIDIRLKGYQNYINWDLHCGHVLRQKTIYPTDQIGTIKFVKDETAPGGWKQTPTGI